MRRRILIADDSPEMSKLVAHVAQGLFPAAQVVSEWKEFTRAFRELEPQIVVLDLVMPDADGIELLGFLGGRSAKPSIILLSGQDRKTLDSARRFAESQGLFVVGALQKPVSIYTLEAALRLAGDQVDAGVDRTRAPAPAYDSWRPTLDEVRTALRGGDIVPYFQPKIRLENLSIGGAEILARWPHPRRGLISPQQFMPVVDSSPEVSIELTISLLQQALRAVEGAPGPEIPMSLNVSVPCLDDMSLPDRIHEITAGAGFDPSRLMIELTESVGAVDRFDAALVLTRLRLKGFGLSLDDFGTGYSTLTQLATLPFNELKIDRTFVAGIGSDRQSESVVESTALMGRQLEMEVCLEGVESQRALQFGVRTGCDSIQGFLFARPMPPDAFGRFASEWVPPAHLMDIVRDARIDFAGTGTPPSRVQKRTRPGTDSVLVVDDDPEIRDMISEVLFASGYEVMTTGSGEDAIMIIERETVRVVLLDVQMPGMSGLDLLRRLRNSSVGVILMSGIQDSELARIAKETGAFDYLAKPDGLRAIRSTVAACVTHLASERPDRRATRAGGP